MESAAAPVSEPLARFLRHSQDYSIKKRRVRPRAFLPARDLALSVYRVDGLGIHEVWSIGDEYLTKRPLGHGTVDSIDVTAFGLLIDADDDPPRHANIRGWPEDKPRQKRIAGELAAKATLYLRD